MLFSSVMYFKTVDNTFFTVMSVEDSLEFAICSPITNERIFMEENYRVFFTPSKF